ncbi:MAG TPA: hypothetical protein VHR72_03945, partial [Gemmataceae bacterium]|nr:hypothetical protein [Gemmataceae bacterium]
RKWTYGDRRLRIIRRIDFISTDVSFCEVTSTIAARGVGSLGSQEQITYPVRPVRAGTGTTRDHDEEERVMLPDVDIGVEHDSEVRFRRIRPGRVVDASFDDASVTQFRDVVVARHRASLPRFATHIRCGLSQPIGRRRILGGHSGHLVASETKFSDLGIGFGRVFGIDEVTERRSFDWDRVASNAGENHGVAGR